MKYTNYLFIFIFAFMLGFSLQAQEGNAIFLQQIPIDVVDDPDSDIDDLARETTRWMDRLESLSYPAFQFQHGSVTCITNKLHYIYCDGEIDTPVIEETLYDIQQSTRDLFTNTINSKQVTISTFKATTTEGNNLLCYYLSVLTNGRRFDYNSLAAVVTPHLRSCVPIIQ